MLVWIAAALLSVFYLLAIPINLALTLRISSRPGFGAGASIFEGHYALKSAILRARGEKKQLPKIKPKQKMELNAVLPPALKASRHLLKHLRLEKLHISGTISAPDAAQTAIICGCCQGIEGILLPFAPSNTIRLNLKPDFSASQSDVLLCGMVSVRAGHIILAALIGAWNYIARRISNGKISD